jgi:hypothetical protein
MSKHIYRWLSARLRGEYYGFLRSFAPDRFRCPYRTIQNAHEYLVEEFMTPAARSRGWLFPWQREALEITERARRRVMPGKAIPW